MAEHEHKPVSPGTYAVVYVCLLLLTALTVWTGTTLKLGSWELVVALGIATVKTALVGLIFMHLSHSNRLTWLVLACAVLFFLVMILITWSDYYTRNWVREGSTPAPLKEPSRYYGQ